jgi:hypothetical protein
MADIFTWVEIMTQADDDWLSLMGGAVSGFNVHGMFKYVGDSGGKSGNAVTFQCKLNKDSENFDICLQYIHDSILPKIRNAAYLSNIISRIALQYDHPSVGGTGFVTTIAYTMNRVTNESGIFFDGGFQTLTIPAGGSGILSGEVTHIEGSKLPAPTTGAAGETPAAKGNPRPPKQWVTYDDPAPTIIPNVAIKLRKAPQGDGYVLLTNDAGGNAVTVAYNFACTDATE